MADGGYVVSANGDGYTIHVGGARDVVAQAGPLNEATASTTNSVSSTALTGPVFGQIGAPVSSACGLLQNGLVDGLTKCNQLLFSTNNDVNSVIGRYLAADDNVAKQYQRLLSELRPDLLPQLAQVPLPVPRPVPAPTPAPGNGTPQLGPGVVDSIMRSEGARGEQGGVPEVYGFRQDMHNGYDEIMAARNQYGQGSAEERAVVTRLLQRTGRLSGAMNFSDPGVQAAITSTGHMRGPGGARAILNSMVTGHIQKTAPLDPNAVQALQQLSPAEFQQRLRDARIQYDQTIYGNTITHQGGRAYRWWDRYGNGLIQRYDREQQQFQGLSNIF